MFPTISSALDVAARGSVADRKELALTTAGRDALQRVVLAIPALADLVMVTATAVIAIGLVGPPVALVYGIGAFLALRYRAGRLLRPRLSKDVATVTTRLGLVGLLVSGLVGTAGLQLTALGVVVVLAGRSIAYLAMAELRRQGFGRERTVIVGAGEVAQELARRLDRRPEEGVEPLGFVDRFGADAQDLPLPALGGVDDLTRVFRTHDVRRAVIAFGRVSDTEMVPLLRRLQRLDVEVHAVPRYFELGSDVEHRSADEIWGIPLVPLHRPARRRWTWRGKRVFDVVVGALLLVVFAPVLGVVGWLVHRSSPGPVIFRQDRVTQDGRTFEVLKFRTMRPSLDSDTEWTADEDRVTRVGRILRRTHLDELPQLINVIRGDMSLVGPRPERPHFVEEFAGTHEGYRDRHRVPAGLTGLAQVNGLWGDTSIDDRVRFDNRYIESWSPWQDLVILARTVHTVLGHQEVEDEEPATGEERDPAVLVTGEIACPASDSAA